ncbi:MAG: fused MFS/spermidine synthase [Actinomycetota bacterium]|nr:fused MFS/spermidine synthase [Actinomycetota bacterium]
MAPQIFNSLLEYPIVVALLLLVMPAIRRPHLPGKLRWAEDVVLAVALFGLVAYILPSQLWSGWTVASLAVLGASLAVAYLLSSRPAMLALSVAVMMGFAFVNTGGSLYGERTFFGVYEVYTEEYDRNVLVHGTTRHGSQNTDPATTMEPLTYFHRGSPIGQVFEGYGGSRSFGNVAVVGLGAGTLAAYGEEGQNFTFYEIDPEVVEIAEDTELFTYLANSRANVEVETGDGRLEIQNAPDGGYDLIILDAFSSDAIPMHLMTREAAASYMEKLSEDGVIAFHITNRHLGLEPIIAGLAGELGLSGLSQYDNSDDFAAGTDASHWVVLTRDEANLAPLEGDGRWGPLDEEEPIVWTDDFSNILSVFFWD